MAYGNDFSSTQSAALSEQAQRQAGMQAAMGHLLGTLQGMREQRNVEAQREMQKQQFQAALTQRAYENKVQEQQQAIANRKLDIQNAVSQGYLKLGQDQLEMQRQGGTPAQVRDKEIQKNNALQAAQRGDFYSADHAKQMYPLLSDPEAQALANTSQGTRDTMHANHQFAIEAAGTMNSAAETDAEIAHLNDKKKNDHWYSHGSPSFTEEDAQRLKDLTARQLKLAPAVKKYSADKRFDGLLSYDAAATNANGTTGAWKPGGAAPTFLMPPGAQPGPAATPVGNGATGSGAGGSWGVPDSGDGVTPDTGSRGITPPPAAATTSSNNPKFYARVNDLISNQNMDPATAKRTAMAEMLNGGSGVSDNAAPDPYMQSGPMGSNRSIVLP